MLWRIIRVHISVVGLTDSGIADGHTQKNPLVLLLRCEETRGYMSEIHSLADDSGAIGAKIITHIQYTPKVANDY